MADSVDRTTEAQTADQLPNPSRGLGWNCRKWSTKQCAFLPSQYQRQARSVSPELQPGFTPNQTALAWVALPAMTLQVMADSVDRTTEAQTADQLPNHSRGLGWNCRKWSTKQCAFLSSQNQRQARLVSPELQPGSTPAQILIGIWLGSSSICGAI